MRIIYRTARVSTGTSVIDSRRFGGTD